MRTVIFAALRQRAWLWFFFGQFLFSLFSFIVKWIQNRRYHHPNSAGWHVSRRCDTDAAAVGRRGFGCFQDLRRHWHSLRRSSNLTDRIIRSILVGLIHHKKLITTSVETLELFSVYIRAFLKEIRTYPSKRVSTLPLPGSERDNTFLKWKIDILRTHTAVRMVLM